jgi:hypothetical protein
MLWLNTGYGIWFNRRYPTPIRMTFVEASKDNERQRRSSLLTFVAVNLLTFVVPSDWPGIRSQRAGTDDKT